MSNLAQIVASAKYQDSTPPLPVGEYRATLAKVLTHNHQQKGPMFIARFTLTASAPLAPATPEQHPMGAERAYIQKTTNTSVAGAAIKGFFYAVTGAKSPEDRAKVDALLTTIIAKVERGEPTGLEGREFAISVRPHQCKPSFAPNGQVIPGALISLMHFSPA